MRILFRFLFALSVFFTGFELLLSEEFSPQSVKFFIVIPSYNNSKWCEKNLESVFFQTYQNWTVYYVNDCSQDATGFLVEQYVDKRGMRNKCHIVHNSTRVGAMENLYRSIHKADLRNVVVTLDGDDRLANNLVLEELARVYADPEVWLTYGSYQYEPGGWRGVCAPLPEDVLANASFRSYAPWITSQLRSFYARLFYLIKKEDLMEDGKFFEISSDVAMFYPMLEMASPNHIRYIDSINYLYNYTNPISDTNRRELQLATDQYIRSLPRYRGLPYLFTD